MKLNYRIVIFALAIVFGVFFSLPSLTQMQGGKKVTLGLDLQGGLHMLLGVQTQKAVEGKIKSVAATVKYFTDNEDILIEDLVIQKDNVSFILLDSDEASKLDTMLDFKLKINGAYDWARWTQKILQKIF